jgi:hypothetical protein
MSDLVNMFDDINLDHVTGKNYNKEYRQQHSKRYKELLAKQYKAIKKLNSKSKKNKKLHHKDSAGKSYNYVNTGPTPNYKANLVCLKCQAPNCKNVVCLGLPLCTEHWAEIGIVRKFVNDEVGYGVFVAPHKCFPARYKIMQYVGEVLTKDEIEYAFPDDALATYTMQIPKQNRFISAERVRGMASYINHSSEPNVKITAIKSKNKYALYVVSLKYLCAGEELLLDYGADYNTMSSADDSVTSEGLLPENEERHGRSLNDSKKPIINSIHGTEFPISHSNSTRYAFRNCPKNANQCTMKKATSKPLDETQDKRRKLVIEEV